MNKSEHIGKLAEALSKAQGAIEGAKKDKSNPFFKSKYADLASVWDACREALSSNGLSVVQFPSLQETRVTLTTVLMHASGEWLSDELAAPLKETTAQAIGSIITYLRRYALAAVVGVAPDEDDDGNAGSGRTATAPKPAGNGLGKHHSSTQTAPASVSTLSPEEQSFAKLEEALPESWTEPEKGKWREAHRADIEKLPTYLKDAFVKAAQAVPVRA